MRVLLVDDSPLIRRQLRRFLDRSDGVESVAEAGDIETALQKAREFDPSLIVVDLRLGESRAGGLELMAAVGREPAAPRMVAFSNHPELQEHALAAGAESFFDKSRDTGALLEFIRSVAREE